MTLDNMIGICDKDLSARDKGSNYSFNCSMENSYIGSLNINGKKVLVYMGTVTGHVVAGKIKHTYTLIEM